MSDAVKITPTLKEVMIKIKAVIDDPVSRQRALNKAGEQLKKIMAIYPPPGIWNRAPGTRGDNRWYERGYGSRWLTRGGQLGGVNNSQKLDRSWVSEKRDEFIQSVFTGVTYAPFLLDPDQRVFWALSHGWVSVDDTVKNFEEEFEKIVLDELDNQIDKI